MAIPDFQSVMRPVLATVQDGAPLALNELRERVADQFQLTEDERKERLPSGNQTVINNRVGWARTYLNKAGLLCIPKKRFWLFQPRKSTEQLKLEYEVESVGKRLAEYQLTRTALSARTSQARCLSCGAEGCSVLPPLEVNYLETGAPVPIGFVHPGCGGQITIACDGMRLSVRLTEKAYDLEGRQVYETEQ